MEKIKLTDRYIGSRAPAPKGKREDHHDSLVPGLALRITDNGHKSFVLHGRFPLNPEKFTRRNLGPYPGLSLDEARDKARAWQRLIERGVDPKVEEERQRSAVLRAQSNTFAAVAEAFLTEATASWAKKDEARATIEREFVARWRARPVTEIEPAECSAAIKAIAARGAPYQAHNAFGYLRSLFNWAIGKGAYGLTASPLDRLKPGAVVGMKREPRQRVLDDEELRLVWQATEKMGYPYGPLFQFLLVTGQREREVSEMRWREVDLASALWTIPAARMKGGRAHEVPLSASALAVLSAMPRWSRGEFIFTTTDGLKPVNGFSKSKVRLDKFIKAERARLANSGDMPAWVLHDIRRTVRTHFSALPVQDMVRELVIAHARPGLHKVYDQHTYRDEKRHCLALWATRLDGIVNPKTGNVTALMPRVSAAT